MNSHDLNRFSLKAIIQISILLTYLSIFFSCATLATEAAAQTLTSTSASWASNLPSNFSQFSLNPDTCLSGDVYGNGTIDLICLNKDPNYGQFYPGAETQAPYALVPSSVLVLKSTQGSSSGFSTTTVNGSITSTTASVNSGTCTVADFDGDGRADLACFRTTYGGSSGPTYGPSENWPTVWLSSSTPFSLSVANQDLAMPIQTGSGDQGAFFLTPFSSHCITGHFMAGPGQQILCNQPALEQINSNGTYTFGPTNNYYLWRYTAQYSSSGVESIIETQYNWTGPPVSQDDVFNTQCVAGDFNGDGLTDIACPDVDGGFNVALSTGTGFINSDWSTSDSYRDNCTAGDFNGDGKTDIMCYAGAGNPLHVYLSTGSGFQQSYQNWAFPNMPPTQYSLNGQIGVLDSTPNILSSVCTAADLNGDGKTDLLCYPHSSGSPGQWLYGLSTGSGFTVSTISSITPPNFQDDADNGVTTNAIPFYSGCTIGNFMGNGIPDILCNESLAGETSLQPYSVGIIARQ